MKIKLIAVAVVLCLAVVGPIVFLLLQTNDPLPLKLEPALVADSEDKNALPSPSVVAVASSSREAIEEDSGARANSSVQAGFTLTGFVTDSQSGAPLTGAIVTVRDSERSRRSMSKGFTV